MQVLIRCLDPKLVRLLVVDRACSAKRRKISNLDFDVIWATQDTAATALKVRPGLKSVYMSR